MEKEEVIIQEEQGVRKYHDCVQNNVMKELLLLLRALDSAFSRTLIRIPFASRAGKGIT